MQIASIIQETKEQLTDKYPSFRNEDGAVDLASIMVGVIVIGLIGGVIAATVFGVIPWTQDKAAQQQLDSVVAAQSAYSGLSSGVPPAVPAGHPANSYASSAQLEEANLLKTGTNHCTVPTDNGKGFIAFTKSDSGKLWSATDKRTKPEVFTNTLPADCSFLAVSDPNDTDGDGIPNASDRDADGDGVQDGYTPGGPIAVLDGTSAPTSGTYFSTVLTAGATTITSNVSNSSAPSSRKIAMHFLVTCVKDDGSFYKRNFLNGYTASTSSYNTNFNTVPCATGERIDEYTVKPVTTEALASGKLENTDYWGGWTFVFNGSPGGYRWSEPDGYPKSGTFQSALLIGGGSTLSVVAQNANGTATTSGFQYATTCERADRTTYSVKRLASWTSRAGYIENTTFNLTPCGADRITAYNVSSTSKLGEVDNRSIFGGYTITGSKSWSETANGYPTAGSFVSSYLAGGGSNIYATVQNGSGTATAISFQYITTCEKADKSIYSNNRLASYTSRQGYIENTVFNLTPCGTDRVIAYEIAPLKKLGDVESRTAFGGYTITGGKIWKEADGYPTAGSFQSSYLAGGGSNIYATVQNGSGTATAISFQYITTCERPDKTTYSVNRIAGYTSRAGIIENTTFNLTPCATDRVIAYQIFGVNKLGDAEDRSVFGGYTITGSRTWAEADGYPTAGSFQSAYVAGGGSSIYATVQNGSGTATNISFQYLTTCERSDKSTFTVNRLAGYTSRAGIIENTTFNLTPCGTDRVIAYQIFAVKTLGEVDNRSVFGGYTITGAKTWSEAVNGYLMSGNYVSSYISGTTLYATFQNENGTATTLATNYTMTCERTDGSTYSVNRLASYTSRAGYIENTTFALTNCGTDRIKAYTIAPVTNLGTVENRSAFGGYSLKGSYSWAG